MIRGSVSFNFEAIVRLPIRGPDGEHHVDFVIDTGFNAGLTLHPAMVATLGLTRINQGLATLADGSRTEYEIFVAEVEWEGAWRAVTVSAVGNEALLGMGMLLAHELRVEAVPGGVVAITPI